MAEYDVTDLRQGERDQNYAEALRSALEEYAQVDKMARKLKVRLVGLQLTIRGLCMLGDIPIPPYMSPGNKTVIVTQEDREEVRRHLPNDKHGAKTS